MGIRKKSQGIDFIDEKTKKAFDELKEIDSELYNHLVRAFNDILNNAFCDVQIRKKLFPIKYGDLNNLWKYNLPGAWRLLYTIKAPNKIQIISVILDWMNHKDYEKLFKF